jgi:hypothetical protein
MEGSKLGGQWNVPSLVANGMFQAWWPMECSKFGGQVKEKHIFTSSHFSPNKFYLNLHFFLLTIRFYFTMVTSYGPQATQANKKLLPESSLDSTLT